MRFIITTQRSSYVIQAKGVSQALSLFERRGRTARDGETVVNIYPAAGRALRKKSAKAARLREGDPFQHPERW